MTDCFWSLYNSTEEVRIDGLRTLQVQALLKCLESLDDWMLWQEGTEAWKPAGEVWTEMQQASGIHGFAPPPVPTRPKAANMNADLQKNIQYEDDDENPREISLVTKEEQRSNQRGVDKRTAPRFYLRLKVHMSIGGKLHSNETLNISMGGMKLKGPLPAGFKGEINVKVVNGDHEMMLRCRTLQSKDEESCTRLLIEKIPKPDVFRAWILAGT